MFHLTKWYLDAVGEDGTAFIGYAARLRWGSLQVRYCATLLAQPGKSVSEMFTLRASPDPLFDEGGVLRWSCRPLSLQGTWTPRCASLRRNLFASRGGDLVWECTAPAATVDLKVGSLQITASGYAERLTMTLPPWDLGIDELHWGRFIADDAWIVWLDWRGSEARRVVVWNGNEMRDAIVDERRISLPAEGGRLDLELDEMAGDRGSRTLREGPLFNIIAAVPGLKHALPRWFGKACEVKRLSRARFQLNETPPIEGWAIHEVVTWRSHVPV